MLYELWIYSITVTLHAPSSHCIVLYTPWYLIPATGLPTEPTTEPPTLGESTVNTTITPFAHLKHTHILTHTCTHTHTHSYCDIHSSYGLHNHYFYSLSLSSCRSGLVPSMCMITCDVMKSSFRFSIHAPDPCISGTVRLVETTITAVGVQDVTTQGKVEICTDGVWSIGCGGSWDEAEAIVTCRQLGLPSLGTYCVLRICV